jgi:hypothetical protein
MEIAQIDRQTAGQTAPEHVFDVPAQHSFTAT